MDKKINKRKVSILIITLILIIIVAIVIVQRIYKEQKTIKEAQQNEIRNEKVLEELKEEEKTPEENQKIDEIKNETGLTGKTDIYEAKQDVDGREIITIKSSIEYKVAFAGIIKNNKIELNEVDDILLKNHPTENGVWVTKESRQSFIGLIKGLVNAKYEINSEGYLKIKEQATKPNNYDELLKKMINGEKQYSIDIDEKCYIVDSVTGEVEEYPFEKMDQYQTYEYFSHDNKTVLIITDNKEQKLTREEILDSIEKLLNK